MCGSEQFSAFVSPLAQLSINFARGYIPKVEPWSDFPCIAGMQKQILLNEKQLFSFWLFFMFVLYLWLVTDLHKVYSSEQFDTVTVKTHEHVNVTWRFSPLTTIHHSSWLVLEENVLYDKCRIWLVAMQWFEKVIQWNMYKIKYNC